VNLCVAIDAIFGHQARCLGTVNVCPIVVKLRRSEHWVAFGRDGELVVGHGKSGLGFAGLGVGFGCKGDRHFVGAC
jgi:hypothetical protein